MSDLPKLSEIRANLPRTDDAARLSLRERNAKALLAAVDAVLALCRDPGEPQRDNTGNFLGFTALDTHRTVGPHRAWSDCGEWCYPSMPCPTCLEPVTAAQIRESLAEHLDVEG